MLKSVVTSIAALTVFAVSPVLAGEVADVDVAAAETGVTSEQAGRIVLQDGQAIGTITEVSEKDNLAVIALMDGSEKEVALGDLMLTEDGSIELVAMATTDDAAPTYE
ncbi:MAG: hypothetical protein AAF221_00190 [Pseudomonadota bacterium]